MYPISCVDVIDCFRQHVRTSACHDRIASVFMCVGVAWGVSREGETERGAVPTLSTGGGCGT